MFPPISDSVATETSFPRIATAAPTSVEMPISAKAVSRA
jgi:hypothetical protein